MSSGKYLNYSYFVKLIVAVLCYYCILSVEAHTVSLPDCFVWGPGLETHYVLPVRYFFIHAVDKNHQNHTESIGENAFAVEILNGNAGQRVRAYIQLLDRHDGSYIVRYKLYETYKDLVINILYNGKHVGNSPYVLKGAVYDEKCYCPILKLEKWLEKMNCPTSHEQIENDLSIFKEINMVPIIKEVTARFNIRGQQSLCHYVIKDNKIYRRTFGQHVGFKMFMDAMLLSITRKVHLPDMEFFVNLGDWPLVRKHTGENPLPIISWCGSDDTHDIVLPTYDVTESTLETMGRVSLDLLSVQANTGPRWQNKTSLAFWRGRDSRQERLDLVKLSRKHPDIIDAKLTNMFFFKHTEDLGETVKPVSFFDFFKHKYQISIDGTVAAYRFPYLMASDSVILKQDSKYYEHFYKLLRPYEHYIPIKHDLSDLLDQIKWAKDNDSQAQRIAKNAQTYMRNNLLSQDIFCYHVTLFKEYANRLVSQPQVLDDMEFVPQPNESNCQCHRNLKKVSIPIYPRIAYHSHPRFKKSYSYHNETKFLTSDVECLLHISVCKKHPPCISSMKNFEQFSPISTRVVTWSKRRNVESLQPVVNTTSGKHYGRKHEW